MCMWYGIWRRFSIFSCSAVLSCCRCSSKPWNNHHQQHAFTVSFQQTSHLITTVSSNETSEWVCHNTHNYGKRRQWYPMIRHYVPAPTVLWHVQNSECRQGSCERHVLSSDEMHRCQAAPLHGCTESKHTTVTCHRITHRKQVRMQCRPPAMGHMTSSITWPFDSPYATSYCNQASISSRRRDIGLQHINERRHIATNMIDESQYQPTDPRVMSLEIDSTTGWPIF